MTHMSYIQSLSYYYKYIGNLLLHIYIYFSTFTVSASYHTKRLTTLEVIQLTMFGFATSSLFTAASIVLPPSSLYLPFYTHLLLSLNILTISLRGIRSGNDTAQEPSTVAAHVD
jgi:hypothetical protein